jgi:hypothetical protein
LTKDDVIKRLLELPEVIAQDERCFLQTQQTLDSARRLLAGKEAELLSSGSIDGKNAEIRAAQLRQSTNEERDAITVIEGNVPWGKIALTCDLNEFSALKSIARLMSVEL